MNSTQNESDHELGPDGRPDFLIKLGVLLPCTVEDVKQAYLAKVKTAHPDVGGTQQQFMELQEAFEQAMEFAQFSSGRRKWLGIQIERYVEQEAALEYIGARGGDVAVERKDWLSREIGQDFAQVLDVIKALRWTGPEVGDSQIQWMLDHRNIFNSLRRLDFSKSQISDDGVLQLASLNALEQLILEQTQITHHALAVLESLTALTYLNIRGTNIGSFRLYWIRRNYPDLEIVH